MFILFVTYVLGQEADSRRIVGIHGNPRVEFVPHIEQSRNGRWED